MNDFIDRKKDSLNPEKKNRVLANGKVSIKLALSISLIFYFLGFILSYVLSVQFFFIVLLIALITIIYSLWLKHCEFLDIILISSNFILRALAGVVLISVVLSPWFFLGIFSLAFFLVSAKRYGDLIFLKKDAKKYKPVLAKYDTEILRSMMHMFMTILVLIFGFYSFFSGKEKLFVLYPLLIYFLLVYYQGVLKGEPYSRNLEKIIFDKRLMITGILLFIGLIIGVYI